jgi:CheY-like chemotaxis protein
MTRVMLVEDNDANRAMLCRRLQPKGYEMVPAENATVALALAQANPPDVILMDIGLPDIDGCEATRRLKADPKTRHIPVIALSAHAQAADRQRAIDAGCCEFETKPVRMDELVKKIEAARAALPKPAPPADDASDFGEITDPTATLSGADVARALKDVCPIRKKHVLIVEDTDANRVMLRRRLEKHGFDVTEAEDGRVALEVVRKHTFDLVLLDLMMPEVDGYEVLTELKKDPDLATIPVIIISAIDEMASVVRCIEAGAEDYLNKPYDPVLLKARVNACLDKRRQRDEELDHLKALAALSAAAGAVEGGKYDATLLQPVADRPDELGRLARIFQKMAAEVQAREAQLRQEVERLKVEIDEVRKQEQVSEITESAYFQELQLKAKALRQGRRRQGPPALD